MNILEKIVESKKREIERLYQQYTLHELSDGATQSRPVTSNTPRFYDKLAASRSASRPFFIAEFKRKSPSEGWINQDADLSAQVLAYAQAGADAISVLTDEPFFGGSYSDLELAAHTVRRVHRPPLILQKDFILDPIQIYLSKRHGADIILLIAAILEPERLDFLKKTAESLGMGVLVEVHDADELAKIRHLDFPVLGVNNRDLKTFRTALNRVNVLAADGARCAVHGARPTENGFTYDKPFLAQGDQFALNPLEQTTDIGQRFIISESGIRDYRDFQIVRRADGFLIGTGLMRGNEAPARLDTHFQSRGKKLFKACGIRAPETLAELSQAVPSSHHLTVPDFIGINFSPVSKRRMDSKTLQVLKTCKVFSNAVAVFYKNTESDIRETLEHFPFRAVQLYAGDVTPAFVRSLKQRVVLAVRVGEHLAGEEDFYRDIQPFAADVDFFILDGATPGSGQRIGTAIPQDFPYPFMLADGLHEGNLEAVLDYDNCIGADIASGIETEGAVDIRKIQSIATRLARLRPIAGPDVLPV